MGETFIRKTATASDEVVMEAIKINKEFPGVTALTVGYFTIRSGEVVALLG